MRQALTAGCAITLYYYCFILTIFLSSLLATQGPAHAQAGPPFTCSGDIYQVQSGQLRIFDPTTSTYTNVGPNNGSYNATGYNILDNYAYASQGGNIIRISSNGVIENVFNIGFGSFSGDVDFSNNYWLRRNNSRYARINLSTGAFTNVDFSGPGGGPADVAYAQSGGTEYLIGFSGSGGGTLYRYNLTTATKENISLPGLPGGGFGAAWTDSTGRLFTFNNGNGQLYEVFDYFTGSPSFTQVGIGDPSGNNDGFSCALAPFPNLAPLAFDDEFTETVNNSVAGNVLPDNGNGADNDPEGLPLTVNTTPITGPANGSVALSADGSFTYTPNLNFVGVDTFVYQIIDASGLTATATVTITITGTIDFTLTKTQISGPNPVAAAGDVIGYEIVLNNIGDIPLSNVVVTDVLPDGSSASLGSRVESGGVGPFAAGRLDLGETWTYTLSYTVTQADIDGGGPLVNSASATTDETGATPRSDTASTAVSSTPSFTVDKAASAATLSAPGTVSYTITVANTGNVTLTNPDFTDDLTQGAAALSLSSGPTLSGDTDGDGDLDTGETWVYAATFDVTQAIIDDGTDLINTAIFNTDQTGPLVDTATTTFTQNPGIDVSKTVDTGTIAAPGTLTYEITAVNTGNVTLTGVALTDTLAQGATGLTLTTGPLLSSGDTDTDGNIDVGETWTYSATFDVTQDELDDGADIVNTASFTTAEGATDSDSATTTITASPSFTIAKQVDVPNISSPGTLTYQVVIENTGNVSLTGISLTDIVNQGAGVIPLATGPTLSGDADSDGEIDPSETWIYTATVSASQAEIDDGNDIVNTATLTTAEAGALADTATTTVSQTSGLNLGKAVAAGNPTSFSAAGDTIDFTYTVTNTGNVTVPGPITISDDQIGAGLACSAGDLAPGATITCDQTWTADQADVDAGSVTNTATASGGAGITSPPATATVTANQNPALSIDKSIVAPVPGVFASGEVLNYEFLVTNTGNVTLSNVIIVDDSITSVSCPALPLGGLQPLGAGPVSALNSITCTATYTINANDVALGSTTNVAFAQTTFDGEDVISPTDSAVFPVAASPVLDLVKSTVPLGVTVANVGDTITYSYTITSVPPVPGPGAELTEPIIIDDDKFAAPFVCYDPVAEGSSFFPGDSHPCTAIYTVTQDDLDAGSVDNTAVAETIFAPASPTPVTVSSPPATESVPVVATPGLSVAKAVTAGPNPASAGDTLTYQIVATNSGNQTLTNVTVTDPLIQDLSCNIAAPVTLAPGAALTCTGTYLVQQLDIDGLTVGVAGTLDNTATVNANNPSGTAIPPVAGANSHPLAAAAPAVSIAKELFPDPAASPAYTAVGDVVQYRMTVTNSGNMTLSSIDVTDSLVAGTCTVGPLAPGATDQTCLFAYTVDQDDIDAGQVLNTGTATAQPADAGAPTVSGTDDNIAPGPTAAGVLTVLKSGSVDLGGDGIANPGDVINYSITVTNSGNVTLSDVTITDAGADGGSITYAPADDGDTDGDIDSLAPGASAVVTAVHTLTQPEIDAGSFSNSATAAGTDPSGTPVADVSDSTNPGDGGGTDDPTVTVIPQGPALTVVKTPSATTGVVVGQTIAYSYLVTNTGNVTLSNIVLDDQHTSAAGTSALAISGTIASLDPGDSGTLTADYIVTQDDIDAGMPLTNVVTANAEAPGSAPDPSASDTASVSLAAQTPALEVIKTVDSISGNRAGDTVTFQISVENAGNVTLTNVTLTDTLTRLDTTPITPDPVPSFVSGDAGTAGALDVGETWIYTVSHVLTQEDVDAGGVTNSATATATPPSGPDVSDISDDDVGGSDPTDALIPPDPTLDVAKTASVPSRVIDNTFSITFSISVENTGNVTQNNISVVDDLTGFLGTATLISATITDFSGPASVLPNPGYDGLGTTEMLSPGAILEVGEAATLELEVVYDAAGATLGGTNTVAVSSDERVTPETATADAVTDVSDAQISVAKIANPTSPARGEVVTYTMFFENGLNTAETGLSLIDELPVGLVYIEGSAVFNGAATPAPVRDGRFLTWSPITLGAGETVAIQIQARVVGGGGTYVNQAYARGPGGGLFSNIATAEIEVRPEAVFDCGDVIGKVFDDLNANGRQDSGAGSADSQSEPGLPGVKVVTSRGVIITTDDEGRFSIPCAELPEAQGTNFVLKLDPRSLPTGYRVTTENPRVTRITAGKLARINFGARLGNILDLDLMASAFRTGEDGLELTPALENALTQVLEQIGDDPTALRVSYLRRNETLEEADERLDLVQEFIEKTWQGFGNYRLPIERTIAAIE